jgi:hypothetical protein
MTINTPRAATALAAIALTTAAQAELITYNLEWSGLSFQNEVTATGQVTIDTELVDNPGFYNGEWEDSAFSNFSITVFNSENGDGTFSTDNDDFEAVIWNVGDESDFSGDDAQPIDLYTELMGQSGFNDFNVFSNKFFPGIPSTPIPNGVGPFTLSVGESDLTTLGGDGQLIQLISMRPVPAPSSLALLGLSALATTRRRR